MRTQQNKRWKSVATRSHMSMQRVWRAFPQQPKQYSAQAEADQISPGQCLLVSAPGAASKVSYNLQTSVAQDPQCVPSLPSAEDVAQNFEGAQRNSLKCSFKISTLGLFWIRWLKTWMTGILALFEAISISPWGLGFVFYLKGKETYIPVVHLKDKRTDLQSTIWRTKQQMDRFTKSKTNKHGTICKPNLNSLVALCYVDQKCKKPIVYPHSVHSIHLRML